MSGRPLKPAGVGGITRHGLRCAFAGIKVAEGRTGLAIQQSSDRVDIKAILIYAHLTDDHADDSGNVDIEPVDRREIQLSMLIDS